MPVLVLASRLDVAAMNIVDKLLHKFSFAESGLFFGGHSVYARGDVYLAYVDCDSIHVSDLGSLARVEAVIFASRHRSESGRPSFTVHVPGNLLDEAPYGGMPREVALAAPERMRAALLSLSEANLRAGLGYSVSLEVTHHGPTGLGVPVVFIEIGSSVEEWRNGRAAEVAAEAVMRAADPDRGGLSAVGFGGGHYAPDFTKLEFEGELAFGHIVPKDAVGALDAGFARRLFERTWGGCRLAVLDWKGVKGVDREALLRFLRDQDVEVLKS